MKIQVEFEFDDCYQCPFIRKGRTYGNDGRDGQVVFICAKGAFGNINDFQKHGYVSGLSSIEGIHKNCPFKKT